MKLFNRPFLFSRKSNTINIRHETSYQDTPSASPVANRVLWLSVASCRCHMFYTAAAFGARKCKQSPAVLHHSFNSFALGSIANLYLVAGSSFALYAEVRPSGRLGQKASSSPAAAEM